MTFNFFVTLFLIAYFPVVSSWNVKSYPLKPVHSTKFPYIIDPDSVLSDTDKQWIANLQLEILDDSKCECFEETLCNNDTKGYTVAIAMTRHVESIVKGIRSQELVIDTFGKGVRQRLNFGHCDDDVLIVVCWAWNLVHLEHGEFVQTKIPNHLKNIMQKQTNEIMDPENLTVAMNFLLYNYYNMLTRLNNVTSSEEFYQTYFAKKELSFGVFTVMVLVGVLSGIWMLCMMFMVGEAVMYHRNQKRQRLARASERKRSDSNPSRSNSVSPRHVSEMPSYVYSNNYGGPIELSSNSPLMRDYCNSIYALPYSLTLNTEETRNHPAENFTIPKIFTDSKRVSSSTADEQTEETKRAVAKKPEENPIFFVNNNNINNSRKTQIKRNKSLPPIPISFRSIVNILSKGVEPLEEDTDEQIFIERF